MRQQLVASARAGESVERTAERLLDEGDPVVRLPEHVRDLTDAARRVATDAEGREVFEATVERWAKRIERLGQAPNAQGERVGPFTVRSATQQLVKDLRRAREGEVDKIVDRWVLDRARYQARLIARHETVEAYRDAYQSGTKDQPGVVGYRWQLSARHPRPDVCDLYANQDLHGLGAGGYVAGEVPKTPHPSCLCTQTAIVDRHYVRRQLARERGEPEPPREWESGTTQTGAEWLAEQPEAYQRALLGPTRAKIFATHPARVISPRGEPIPVHQVLGRPAPRRRLGPAVRARPLVRADRASMVQPFPPAPRLVASGGAPATVLAPAAPEQLRLWTAAETLRGIEGLVGDPESPATQDTLRRVVGDNVSPETINRLGSLPEGYRHARRAVTVRERSDGPILVLSSKIETTAGAEVGDLIRTLRRAQDGRLIAHHDYFVMAKPYQGRGIASHVLRQQFRSYLDLGVREIRVDTAYEGKFVWAKMGFAWDAETAHAMQTRLRSFLIREHGIDWEGASALAADLALDAWRLARAEVNGVPIGEVFLMSGHGWHGRIDMTPGSQARQRYTRAIRFDDE